MADLKETDEPVEKAGKVNFRGKLVSRAQRRNLAEGSARAKLGFKGVRANTKMSPKAYAMHRRISGRNHIKKSADPISTLYAEIEKARGLIPKGGSKRMVGIVGRKAAKRYGGSTHVTRLKNYIEDRADNVKAVRGYGGSPWSYYARTVTPRGSKRK